MSESIPVFVNDTAVRVPPACSVAQAVRAFDAALAAALETGGARVTDGRGIGLAAGTPVYSGAILRVIVSARQNREERDAHP